MRSGLIVLALGCLLAHSGTGLAQSPEPDWWEFNPPGSKNGNMLEDVLSRLPPRERGIAQDSDRITFCHEGTHQIHSVIRNTMPGGTSAYNAVYVGGGRCLTFREPKVRIEMVRAYWPTKWPDGRRIEYPTELAFPHWQKEPLYLVDEWAAYCNGTQYGLEAGLQLRGSDKFMEASEHWCFALLFCIKERDPNYPDLQKLEQFLEWQSARAERLLRQIKGTTSHGTWDLAGPTPCLTGDWTQR